MILKGFRNQQEGLRQHPTDMLQHATPTCCNPQTILQTSTNLQTLKGTSWNIHEAAKCLRFLRIRIVCGNLSPLGVDVRLSTQSKSFKDQSSSGRGLDPNQTRNLWNGNHKNSERTAKHQQIESDIRDKMI